MIFSVLQENLKQVLTVVSKAADAKPVLPILANVKFEADNGELYVTATNLAVTLEMKAGAKVDYPGSITLPAKTITELVGKVAPERMDFVLDVGTQTCHIKVGSSKFAVKGITAQEFPRIVKPDTGDYFEVDAQAFRRAIRQVAGFGADEDMRPILKGVNFKFDKGCLMVTALDGYTLATTSVPVVGNTSTTMNLPDIAGDLLAKLIDDELETLTIQTDGERVVFGIGRINLLSQLLEGRFPDISAIIPSTNDLNRMEVLVNRTDLIAGCKRAEIFARDSAYSVRATFTPSLSDAPSELRVVGKSAERGEGETAMDVAWINPVRSSMELAFNVSYMKRMAEALDAEGLLVSASGPAHPILVRMENDPFMGIVMPMQVNR